MQPWLERVEYLKEFRGLKFDAERFPKLYAYIARMKELKAVKDTYTTPDKYDRFFQGYLAGKPQYDFE